MRPWQSFGCSGQIVAFKIELYPDSRWPMYLEQVRAVVKRALQLGPRAERMDAATPLLGAIPELDSMAVVNVLTALEEHFDISIADDEIDGATFATLGSLVHFVEQKLGR